MDSENLTQAHSRALATIETVRSITPIPGADAILQAQIRGWSTVVKMGEFQVNDTCLYLEVDSFIAQLDKRFEFLAPRGVRTDTNGNQGYVLKTAKLRGVYSQGLALPLTFFPELLSLPVGSDVTDLLGIKLFEPKIPDELIGHVRGVRPSWIPATDEVRIQNLESILQERDHTWVATEKIDGTSTTIYTDPDTGIDGVCTRNYDLLESNDTAPWLLTKKLNLHAKIKQSWPKSKVALQGEMYGDISGGNPLKINGKAFAAFTLRVNQQELPRSLWPDWLLEIAVPIHSELSFPKTLDQALQDVDAIYSKITPTQYAEGVVWRALNTSQIKTKQDTFLRASFKVISNKYLLKHDS